MSQPTQHPVVNCRFCQTPLDLKPHNQQAGWIYCGECNSLQALREMPLPPGYEIAPPDQEFRLTYRWYSAKSWIYSGLWLFYTGGVLLLDLAPTSMFCFCIIPLLILSMIGMTYLLASFFNHTTISIQKGELIVENKPIPWFKNQRIKIADIKDIFSQMSSGVAIPTEYQVAVHLHSTGEMERLAGDLTAPQALFVEQELKRRLNNY